MAFLGSASPPPSSVQSRERERQVLFSDTPGNLTGPTFRLYQRDSLGAYVAVVRLGRRGERIVRRDVVSWKGSPEIDWLHSGEMSVIGIPLNATLDQLFFTRTVTIIHLQSGAVTPLALAERDAPRNPAWAPSGGRLAYLKLGRPTMDLTRPLIAYTVRAVDRTKGVSRIALSEEADGLWDLPPLWSADERTLYIGRYVRGTARLFAIDVATGSWKALTEDTLSVAYYSLAHDGKHLVVAMENSNQPRELYRLDPVSGAATRLTHEGDALLRRPLGQVEAVAWPSSDGRFTIHGYLVKPASYDRRRRYPLIVVVHGGPGAFYTNSFMGVRFNAIYLPAQLLAAVGYLVLLPNPRGDSSYGPAFQVALNGDLAAGPFRDIDSGVAALVARGLADSTSLGIYGASYGGYLTAFTVTQTHRYAAAVVDDGPINLSSLFGQEYAQGTMLLRYRLGGNPWTSRFAYTAQSPITFVDRVRTPVLMRYGGRSASAPDAIRMSLLAQGLEFYAGLTENKVPVEFVLHPDQGHAIADWQLYRDWVGRSLAWFRRWMPRSDIAR
jgi:dipeptidyl aminopeptidase/acylaminoacyl peptidase